MPSAAARAGPFSIPRLRAELGGTVIAPYDAGYDEARTVVYGGFDRRPAAIVRAAGADDVARVVTIARETGLELAVRGGGHSNAGHSTTDGGIVLDLRDLRALEIDPEGRTAWADAGLTAGEYTAAAWAHGLATGFGDTGSVGIAGLTLGGGVGYLVRWAIRGGGGNFGVATRLRLRLHDLGSPVGGMLVLPATADTVAGFIAAAEAAPDELSTIGNVMPAPPMPFLPEEVHGRLVILAMLVHAGDAAAGERAVTPFRALGTPLADMVGPMPYPDVYPPDDPDYHPTAVARTMFVDAIDGGVAETIVEYLGASDASMRVAQLRVLGGAMARVPSDATAFAHRASRIMVNVAAFYDGPEDRVIRDAWVTDFAEALQQDDSGAYVNFLGEEGEARIRAVYPGTTWDRLAAIKRRYDPTNLFRLNQNIPPAGDGGAPERNA